MQLYHWILKPKIPTTMKKSRLYFIAFVLLIFAGAIAAPSLEKEAVSEFISDPTIWIIGLVVLFLIFSIIAVTNALDSIKYHVLKKEGRLAELGEGEEAAEDGFDNALTRLWQRMQDAKPIEEESEIELDHNYDGIHELDNNLPPWWLWGFYLSIAFAVVYLMRFHVLETAPLQQAEYEQQMAEAEIQKAEYLKNAANLVDETSVAMLTDEGLIKEGATIYAENCAVCHANDGGGGVGPNLTDPYWKHGGNISDVFSTIKYGVPAKGMIAWKDQLNPSKMQKVASFIMTMQGTTPLDPKEPEGDLVEQTSDASKEVTDSLSTTTTEVADTLNVDQ